MFKIHSAGYVLKEGERIVELLILTPAALPSRAGICRKACHAGARTAQTVCPCDVVLSAQPTSAGASAIDCWHLDRTS
jgi:hypothetical protein